MRVQLQLSTSAKTVRCEISDLDECAATAGLNAEDALVLHSFADLLSRLHDGYPDASMVLITPDTVTKVLGAEPAKPA